MVTAQTAVIGATTAIEPIASARYSSATPMPPATPAAAPQIQSLGAGDDAGRKGSINPSTIRPASWEMTTMAMVFARREANPPRKSAAP